MTDQEDRLKALNLSFEIQKEVWDTGREFPTTSLSAVNQVITGATLIEEYIQGDLPL